MRKKISLLMVLFIHFSLSVAAEYRQPLKVSSTKRFLVDQDNKPVFLVADTRWAIFSFPGKTDVIYYLNKRKEQKFNALLVHMLPWKDSKYRTPVGSTDYSTSPSGEFPFVNDDFTKPNEAYWGYVDQILAECASRDFTMIMVAAWQANWKTHVIKTGYAKSYGEFIGKRYKSYKNKIYLMGGDNTPDDAVKLAYDEMAKAIKAQDPAVLISYHPVGNGHSSSEWFSNYSWMDFNSVQTTNDNTQNYTLLENDYKISPVKPSWLVEPGYENQDDRATPFTIRRCGYWSTFSGGFSYGYGNYPVWNSGAPEGQRGYGEDWKKAMTTNGAESMKYLRALMDSIPWFACSPLERNSVLSGTYTADIRVLANSSTKDFAALYLPLSTTIKIKMGFFAPKSIKAQWYDPANGTYKSVNGSPFVNSGDISFTTPGNNTFGDKDWVLVLSSAGSTSNRNVKNADKIATVPTQTQIVNLNGQKVVTSGFKSCHSAAGAYIYRMVSAKSTTVENRTVVE